MHTWGANGSSELSKYKRCYIKTGHPYNAPEGNPRQNIIDENVCSRAEDRDHDVMPDGDGGIASHSAERPVGVTSWTTSTVSVAGAAIRGIDSKEYLDWKASQREPKWESERKKEWVEGQERRRYLRWTMMFSQVNGKWGRDRQRRRKTFVKYLLYTLQKQKGPSNERKICVTNGEVNDSDRRLIKYVRKITKPSDSIWLQN